MKFGFKFGLLGGGLSAGPPVDPGHYIFYEYAEFLALPARMAVDSGTLYPDGYDGALKSSSFVVPGPEGINYPIVHDLGAELVINGEFDGSGITAWTSTSGTLTEENGAMVCVKTLELNEPYNLAFRANANFVGDLVIGKVYILTVTSKSDGSLYEHLLKNVDYAELGVMSNIEYQTITYTFTAETTRPTFMGRNRGDVASMGDTISISHFSIKEVILPAESYLSYFDIDGSVVSPVLAPSTTYNLQETHQWVWNGTAPLSVDDVLALEANPNLIAQVYFNGAVLPSGYSSADMGNVFPCSDYGDYIQDISGGASVLLGTGSRLVNQVNGLSDFGINKDASGRALGTPIPQALSCHGTGEQNDTGVIIDGTISDFSMAMAFSMDDNYDVDRYLVQGGTGTNRVEIVQTGIRTIRGQVGQFVIPPTVLPAGMEFYALGMNFNFVDGTIQFAFNGDGMAVPIPCVFDGAISTAVKIGTDSVGTPATAWNNGIGIGFLKTTTTTESEWQSFWAEVKTLYGFDGGMFINGGFENGISNWKLYPTNGSWTATSDDDTAENIPNTTGTHFYQDFTLEAGATYELSADQVGGDGTVTYCINTADSGILIADGPTRFIGKSSPESIGVTMSIAGTTPAVVDNLRLVKIEPETEEVTYKGEVVTHKGVPVTYTKGA